jgi:hypothetical protein
MVNRNSKLENRKGGQARLETKHEDHLLRLALTRGTVQCRLLRADYRVIFGVLIYLKPAEVFLGNRHIRKDRLDGAFRKARVTINARIGIYKKLVRQFVKSFNRTNGGAIGVFAVDTRFGNDVCHLGEILLAIRV